MSGIELLEAMHDAHTDLPVLVVSGQMDQPMPSAWPANAVVRFLAKPISGVLLRRTIEGMLAEHAELRATTASGSGAPA